MSQSKAATVRGPSGPWRSAFVGVIFGVDATGHCLALASVCFAGTLAAGLGLGTALFLFGTLISTLAMLRFGRFGAALSVSQDTAISILAPAVALAAAASTGPAEAKLATAIAVIGVSAFASGFAFWIIGRLGLGRLVRMFPYPVAAGFLASSGYLLVYAGLSILTKQSSFSAMFGALGDPLVQLRLVPAVAMAMAMVLAIRFLRGPSPVLWIVLISLVGYYAVSLILGVTIAQAVNLGLLPLVEVTAGPRLSVGLFDQIDWAAVASVSTILAAVVLLNLIGFLLNLSGVELATRSDVEENHELKVSGATNMVIGLFGGLTAYLQGGANIILSKLDVTRATMMLGYCTTVAVAAFFAPLIVAFVPVFIPAALVMFIGISMLADWLFGTRKRLTGLDWLIVVIIVLATALIGILSAIGIGLGLAILGFAYASIRLPIIRHSTSSAKRRSIRDRSALHGEVLEQEGHRIRILHLQGPLFFGSVEQMISHLRGIIVADPDVGFVVLDFAEVHSFDSSACAALDKLSHLMQTQGIKIHLTGVSEGLNAVFSRWGLPLVEGAQSDKGGGFCLWTQFDEALEHCETALLKDIGQLHEEADIAEILFDLARRHPRTTELVALMDRQVIECGAYLIRAADPSRDVFIVASGRFGVHLPAGPRTNGSVRVRSMGSGAIVGEIAYLTGQLRNADVVCEERALVLGLSEAKIRRIEAEDPDLAAVLMSIFSRSLAVKLAQTNGLLTYAQSAATSGAGYIL